MALAIILCMLCSLLPSLSRQLPLRKAILRHRSSVFLNDGLWNNPWLKEGWFTQPLDHFRQHPKRDEQPTFQQRYFICDEHWARNPDGSRGPIFFYAGNEADVTLYVNATGLIWENAPAFGALVLFAEHRYYGKTQPFGPDSWQSDPSYLNVEQALADYAALLWHLSRQMDAEDSPVIAFGGSYGGMLAAWLRLKYPHLVAGAVAASAPVGAFPHVPGWEPARFWEVVTYDATACAGSAPACAANLRAAFGLVMSMGRSAGGRQTLGRLLRLCEPLKDEDEAVAAAYWLQGAFDAFAMGNYPYTSTYISDDPDHPLPAWPMRAACQHLARDRLGGRELVEALRDAVGVLYNVSGRISCFDLQTAGPAAGNQGPWDYQWCTQMMAQELPYYPANGISDMFWDQGPFDPEVIDDHCWSSWGVMPRSDWAPITYGGLDVRAASNIAFSNGLYDPWSAYGVLSNLSDSLVALIIPEGAHHLDLMFSHPDDPGCVRAARAAEMRLVADWVQQHQEELGTRGGRRRRQREEGKGEQGGAGEGAARWHCDAEDAVKSRLGGVVRKGEEGMFKLGWGGQ